MIKKVLKTLATSTILCVAGLAFISVANEAYDDYLYEFKGASVVKITRSYQAISGGTGFQVQAPSGNSFIMTNAHICKIGKSLVITTKSGKQQRSKVLEIYKEHDLCVMQGIKGLPSLKIASNLELREKVFLIGHPALRGLTLESGYFVESTTIQLVSDCKEPSKKFKSTGDPLEDILQFFYNFCTVTMTSNHINNISYGGNSGSPVLNIYGNVVGVLYAGRRDQNTASHMVPLEEIKKFLADK